jgi:pimeloyl-ACP methyl ester carboxylesterase
MEFTPGSKAMTFVLVHGSHDGGWIWHKLTPLLQNAGHAVFAPTLSGLSDRAHLLPCGIDLTTHITDIVNLVTFQDLTEVLLVGNSYAGMVITGVAAQIPERLRLLVYLDAYLPEDGQSEVDLLPPGMRAARQAEAQANGGVTLPPPPSVFGVTDSTLADWLRARMTPHPWATYTEPVPHGNSASRAIPRAYILCTGGESVSIFAPFANKARAAGWPVYELAQNHIAMLTAPDEVAQILLALAR